MQWGRKVVSSHLCNKSNTIDPFNAKSIKWSDKFSRRAKWLFNRSSREGRVMMLRRRRRIDRISLGFVRWSIVCSRCALIMSSGHKMSKWARWCSSSFEQEDESMKQQTDPSDQTRGVFSDNEKEKRRSTYRFHMLDASSRLKSNYLSSTHFSFSYLLMQSQFQFYLSAIWRRRRRTKRRRKTIRRRRRHALHHHHG